MTEVSISVITGAFLRHLCEQNTFICDLSENGNTLQLLSGMLYSVPMLSRLERISQFQYFKHSMCVCVMYCIYTCIGEWC